MGKRRADSSGVQLEADGDCRSMGQALLSKLAAEPNTPFPYGTIEAEIPESSGPAKVWSASNLAQYKGTVRWVKQRERLRLFSGAKAEQMSSFITAPFKWMATRV